MLVYLAAPIDHAEGHDGWWGEAADELLSAGVDAVYRPGLAWSVAGRGDTRVQDVNMSVLARADAVLGFLPPGVPSVGVPVELFTGCTREIPVVVVVPGEHRSMVLDWMGVSVVSGLGAAVPLLVAMVQESRLLGGGSDG